MSHRLACRLAHGPVSGLSGPHRKAGGCRLQQLSSACPPLPPGSEEPQGPAANSWAAIQTKATRCHRCGPYNLRDSSPCHRLLLQQACWGGVCSGIKQAGRRHLTSPQKVVPFWGSTYTTNPSSRGQDGRLPAGQAQAKLRKREGAWPISEQRQSDERIYGEAWAAAQEPHRARSRRSKPPPRTTHYASTCVGWNPSPIPPQQQLQRTSQQVARHVKRCEAADVPLSGQRPR